jgi:hypothetical protein
MAESIDRPRPPSALASSFRLGLVGAIGIMAAGCTGSAANPTAAAAIPSVQTVLASSTPMLAPRPSITSTASVTPQPTLDFVATSGLHTARAAATATRLKNGKVLIAGGGILSGDPSLQAAYASAELYDPATESSPRPDRCQYREWAKRRPCSQTAAS